MIYEGYFNDVELSSDDIVVDVEQSNNIDNKKYQYHIDLEYELDEYTEEGVEDGKEEDVESFCDSVNIIFKRLRNVLNSFPFVNDISKEFVVSNASYEIRDAVYKIGSISIKTDSHNGLKEVRNIMISFGMDANFKSIRQLDKFHSILSRLNRNTILYFNGYYVNDKDYVHIYDFNTDDCLAEYKDEISHLSYEIFDRDMTAEIYKFYTDNNAMDVLCNEVFGGDSICLNDLKQLISKEVVADRIVLFDTAEFSNKEIYMCGRLNKPVWDEEEIREYIFNNPYKVCVRHGLGIHGEEGLKEVIFVFDGLFHDADGTNKVVTMSSTCKNVYMKDKYEYIDQGRPTDVEGFENVVNMLKTAGLDDSLVDNVLGIMDKYSGGIETIIKQYRRKHNNV